MNKYIVYVTLCLCSVLSGCFSGSVRTYTAVSTDDIGDGISTKHRYTIKDSETLLGITYGNGIKSMESAIKNAIENKVSIKEKEADELICESGNKVIEYMTSKYPNVFSDSGIPVKIRLSSSTIGCRNQWTILLTILSVTLFPEIGIQYEKRTVDLMIGDDIEVRDSFAHESVNEYAQGIFPTALIPFGGKPNCGTKRVYWRSDKVVGSDTTVSTRTKFYKRNPDLDLDGFAYGVAAKLKEMEDSGKIDALLQKRERVKFKKLDAERLKSPAHRVVRLAHDVGGDFSCRFTLELLEMPIDPDKAKSAVLQDFGEALKKEYAYSVSGAKQMPLVVNYTDVKIDGRLIQGRATVLAMSIVSLSYDSNTRRGKLEVRFNSGQADEARAWILRNVKTLARDKNIALTTGTLPPEATYYSLGEKIEGNVMEIEFKTE